MSLVLRAPTLADATALALFHVSAWRETYAHLLTDDFFTEEFADGRQAMWNHVLDNPREGWEIRVAESDGSIVGFGWAGPSLKPDGGDVPRDRQLFALYVVGAWHGRGVGQALLDETLAELPAVLWVAEQNPRAVAFYRRNGFEFDGTTQIDPAAPAIVDARMVR